MNKIDLVNDEWWCTFNSKKEFEMILLTLNVFGKERFFIPIQEISSGIFYNGYRHYDASENRNNMDNWPEVSLEYILNYEP